jgi:hypothetical protein
MWRSDAPATLVFTEALDGGDQSKLQNTEMRFYLGSTFYCCSEIFLQNKTEIQDVSWTNDHYAIVSEDWYDTRNTKSFLVDLNNGESK